MNQRENRIISLLLDKFISFDPSLEPSWQDGSNEGSELPYLFGYKTGSSPV